MDVTDLAAGVFIGNLMTLSFLWGAMKFARSERDEDVPWLPYFAVMFPFVIGLIALYLSSGPPQILGAAAALQ